MILDATAVSDGDFVGNRHGGDCSNPFQNNFGCSAVFNFYLTGKCNLRCAYCFEDRRDLPPDMSAEQVRKYIEEISKENNNQSTLVMFGGEPTLRWDLVLAALEMRNTICSHSSFKFVVFSNGIDLDSLRLSSIVDGGGELFISYDGGSGNSRLRFGNRTGVLEAVVLGNMRSATEYGVPLTVSMSLGRHNIEKALQEMQCLNSRFGVIKFKVNNIRRYPFCCEPNVWDKQRSLALDWARSNDIAMSWATFDHVGSKHPAWYISSRSVRLVCPFEKATWNASAW